MLKLERVEISGFKSFYEKVDLAFPGSVTAVVGPNGCGKSNICDAVAWALGEQSARILRGERMDDVIFNGSAKRRPLGMAEVTLTLSRRGANGNGNGNGHGDAEPETLRIGRRVYRDGQGEYFLNDKQVRLKDIQDQLLGTGLGVRAYSVIEQGRIDQVLSTKPQDRRRLIEEAAGITRYKLKKRLAETKLEETKGNLLRLSDIISEIERNCASLKRQASRAARYKEQSEALRVRRSALARARHDRLSETRLAAERVRNERRDAEAQAAAALGRAEAELAQARLLASEADSEHNRVREAIASIEASIEREGALLEANRRATTDLALRRDALEKESRSFTSERERAARERAEIDERLEAAVNEARARSLAREEADRRASEAAATFGLREQELEAARAEALSAAGGRVAARNARHEAELEATRLSASLARLSEEAAKAGREVTLREAEAAAAKVEREKLAQESQEALLGLAEAETELARLESAVVERESARESGREALAEIERRLAAAAAVLSSHAGSVEDARSALRSAGFAESGVLLQRLQPSPGWEAAVDLLLAEDLRALIAPEEAILRLAAGPASSATRLVRDGWEGRDAPTKVAGTLGGWEVALANFDALSSAERGALPRAAFVERLPDALGLAEREPHVTFVTRRGEAVRGSLVRLSKERPGAEGLFALSREKAEMEERRGSGRKSLATAEASIEELRSARQEAESLVRQRRELEREITSVFFALRATLEERSSELVRLRREAETLALEMGVLREQMASNEAGRAKLGREEERHAEREESLRQRAEMLAAALSEARSLAQSLSDELAHRRTEAEVAAERRRSLEAARAKLLETESLLERRAAEASEEERRLSARTGELSHEETETRERQATSVRERADRARELDRTAPAAADASARVARAEEDARSRRATLDTVREGRFEAEVLETRAAADLDHVIAQAKEEFGAEPADLAPPEDTSDESLAAQESEAAELAASLERIGPVNVLAFEEHQEETKRLSFLTAQRDDLLKSIAELQDSIRKINATSSARFSEAFAAVNANFKEMFARLFRGGTAEMRLLDESDPLESGVEIVAQPPGKRNQSILLLSGGEKALTAIALLMAIFRYKPSPFCILDEVDAPLDEANIDRFTRLLKDMTEETQFIAITHNKRTMETADAMYGVTMEEPGCSKIVSVKFD